MRVEELRPIDGLSLSVEYRALLRPGEAESDWAGTVHRLPRFFYEIGSWQDAQAIHLAPHFTLAELMLVDCREAERIAPALSALCAMRGYFACGVFGGFSSGSWRAGLHQRKWRLSVARASDWRGKKYSCLGNSGEHLPHRRHLSR